MTSVAQERSVESEVRRGHIPLASYILFAGTAALLALTFVLPSFRVAKVQIVGGNLPANRMIHDSGAIGRNVFTVRAASIVQRLERIPSILVLGVDVSLPNVVTVRAEMSRPIFGWRQSGKLYLVDKYGRLVDSAQRTTLPVVDNNTHQQFRLGGYIDPRIAMAVPYTEQTLPRAGIRWFNLGRTRGLMIHSQQGWGAVLGRPTGRRLVTRIATLKAFLAATAHDGRHLTWIDLRSRSPYASFS